MVNPYVWFEREITAVLKGAEVDLVDLPKSHEHMLGCPFSSKAEECNCEIVLAACVKGVQEGAYDFPFCYSCMNYIDREMCWCGSGKDGHGYLDGHSFVPMGCDCSRA